MSLMIEQKRSFYKVIHQGFIGIIIEGLEQYKLR